MGMKRGIIKRFREFLNREYGFTDERWGSRGSFGAQTRLYGDYLYAQDREMFRFELENAMKGNPDNSNHKFYLEESKK